MSFKNCRGKKKKKLMNAFTDEKQRSYIEQQLPPAAGSGGAPRGEAPFNLLTLHTSARPNKVPEDRRKEAILHNLCIQRPTATRQYR